jgi:hypothetical protein
MFVELATIQRFILVLSQPIFSVSIVIFSLLLGSGVGSYLSSRIDPLSKKHKFVLLCIALLLPLYGLTSNLLGPLLSLPPFLRALFSFLVISPLGLLMGMPFPLGLRVLKDSNRSLIPWAWAINGCASVLGSLLPIILALFLGYSWVFLIAGFAYLASLLVVLIFK